MKLGKKDVTELYLELEHEREVRQDFKLLILEISHLYQKQ